MPALRLLALAALALACGRPPGPPSPGLEDSSPTERFSGAAAMLRVDRLLDRYPRALGDSGRVAAIDNLAADLQAAGAAEIERLDHDGADPITGRAFAMTTLLGHVRPEATRRFVRTS